MKTKDANPTNKTAGTIQSSLETEKLLNENKVGEGKNKIETQMILNHKEKDPKKNRDLLLIQPNSIIFKANFYVFSCLIWSVDYDFILHSLP